MLTQEGQFVFDKSSEAAESQVLFGPPALLPGESLAEYWRLYSLFQADIAPADVIEKIWHRDLVDLPRQVEPLEHLGHELSAALELGGEARLPLRVGKGVE